MPLECRQPPGQYAAQLCPRWRRLRSAIHTQSEIEVRGLEVVQSVVDQIHAVDLGLPCVGRCTRRNVKLLKHAIDHPRGELPEGKAEGKKRLDLIVATHRHEDHIKGCNSEWFSNIEVCNIWQSAAMDPIKGKTKKAGYIHG